MRNKNSYKNSKLGFKKQKEPIPECNYSYPKFNKAEEPIPRVSKD